MAEAMIQEIGRHRYHNEYHPEARPSDDSRILFYQGRKIFVKMENSGICYLTFAEVIRVWPDLKEKATFLFSIDGVEYYLFREFDEEKSLLEFFPDFSWEGIELMRVAIPKDAAFAGVTGMQLCEWYKSRRFCPACGRPMEHSMRERMMQCPACGQIEYPKICPAVIVAVTDADRILLTKYAGRSFKNYALIAGFSEIGETLEETVEREVMEEVGLKIKNIRYYKSQPWSFTGTLLAGFFAEADQNTEILMDEGELSVAKWCTRDEIPEDDGVSLTREMMNVFKSGKMPV